MEFLQPYMLWAVSAVALPVIIHFWYQKKGKQIAWAASQWLLEKSSQQHRGIKLDEIPLLLIRCLLIILLAMLLSKPVLSWLDQKATKQEIHLVQADPKVVSNFRFEIENALKKKEKVIWVGTESKPLTDISAVPEEKHGLLSLQQTVNTITDNGTNLNLYLINTQQISQLRKIYVPGTYKLHTIQDSARKPENPISVLARKLGKNYIKVLIDYRNPDEAKTVQAGLAALESVFQVPFAINFKTVPQVKYDWIFTDKPILNQNEQTLYVVQERNIGDRVFTNVVLVSDSLRTATSQMVQNGQLPEWFGELLIAHYNLDGNKAPLSQKQLNAVFESVKPEKGQSANELQQWLSLLFILTLILERWISLKQNPARIHA